MSNLISPCIKICRLYNGVCIGCFRTQNEIKKWFTATDTEKLKIYESCIMRKEDTTVVQIQKLRSDATVPTRGSSQAAGSDLYAVETVEIQPGDRAIVSTGIAMAIPTDVYARIAPRSGLAAKNGIDVLAGVVDSDYRGEIKVILVNLGKERFIIKPGDRIAQVIFERIKLPLFSEVNNLSETDRNTGGFGSTGK